MITASGELATNLRVTSATILALVSMRSMRLIPGLRATPAVITQTSEPAVSSYPLLPTMRVSKPSIDRACIMSRANP